MTEKHNNKNGLDIDSSMLEVVNVHQVIWIIVIYKYKLHQQIKAISWQKGCYHIFANSYFVFIGNLPILTGTFQHCSLTNAVTQKEALAKEQTWDVSIAIKCFI